MNKLMFYLVFKLKKNYNNKWLLCCIVPLNFVIIVNKIDCSIVVVVVIVSKIEYI